MEDKSMSTEFEPRVIHDMIYMLHLEKKVGYKDKIEFLRIRYGKCKDHGEICINDTFTARCLICDEPSDFMMTLANIMQVTLNAYHQMHKLTHI